jgi:hypothetical protein
LLHVTQAGVRRNGKLTLVDLAGSERLKSVNHTDASAIKETGAINKSLFILGQVCEAYCLYYPTGNTI